MGKIKFLPSERECEFKEGQTVLEVALKHKVEINHSCEGMGSCTTCRVLIESGLESLPDRSDFEQEHATERNFSNNERLSCQTPAKNGLIIKIP